MKINVDKYRTYIKSKDQFLSIEISITLPNGEVQKTGTKICLTPLGYFYGRVPDSVSSLLYVASAIYAIDRSVARKKYSIDGWSREFEVDFKIPVPEVFSNNKELIDTLLSFLTGDYWDCSFSLWQKPNLVTWGDTDYFDKVTQVNLFSGGMDSLIGAIDFMETNENGQVFLASHHDDGMGGPKIDQQRLVEKFTTKYKGKFLRFPKNPSVLINSEISAETTCRSRSLMFLAIALQVAAYKGVDIVVPENGSVSLNFPLSVSRRASCSTRTTHPVVIAKMNELLTNFGLQIRINNPYEYKTKGEMVRDCKNPEYLLDINPLSNSCGKRSRRQYFYDNSNATHCGRCMPCMYRKAALLGFEDRSSYGITMTTLFQKKENKVSDDFFAMLSFLKRDLTDEDIRKELSIAGMGGMPNIERYVALVHRTRAELRRLIDNDGDAQVKNFIQR